MDALKKFVTPSNLIGAAALVAVASAGIVFVISLRKPASAYSEVSNGGLVEEVDTTGVVKAAEAIDLSFQRSGQIASVNAPVGKVVSPAQTLAYLSAGDVSASLEQAKAALAVQQAKLDAVKVGTRPEDIAVSQIAVTAAESSVAQSAQDAYIKADDAIHNKVDQFFQNPRSVSPKLNINISDSQAALDIESNRPGMEILLLSWQKDIAVSSSGNGATLTDAQINTAKNNIAAVSAYLDTVANGLSKLTPSSALPLATIQTYQSNIATARSAVSGSLAALIAANNTLLNVKSQLALKQAGATPQDLEAQIAQVAAAEANVHAAEAEMSKAVIRAPIGGVITKNDAHVGGTATPGVVLISMNSTARFQVEAYVSEADFAKIAVGDEVSVFLDAYQNAPAFRAHVTAIDPAATIQNGVASYKVTAQFDTDDAQIKAGLTANLHIISAKKDSVLRVPTSALITKGGIVYVLRKGTKDDELVNVKVGITGDDGYTEIQSGLSSGDQVRSFGASE